MSSSQTGMSGLEEMSARFDLWVGETFAPPPVVQQPSPPLRLPFHRDQLLVTSTARMLAAGLSPAEFGLNTKLDPHNLFPTNHVVRHIVPNLSHGKCACSQPITW